MSFFSSQKEKQSSGKVDGLGDGFSGSSEPRPPLDSRDVKNNNGNRHESSIRSSVDSDSRKSTSSASPPTPLSMRSSHSFRRDGLRQGPDYSSILLVDSDSPIDTPPSAAYSAFSFSIPPSALSSPQPIPQNQDDQQQSYFFQNVKPSIASTGTTSQFQDLESVPASDISYTLDNSYGSPRGNWRKRSRSFQNKWISKEAGSIARERGGSGGGEEAKGEPQEYELLQRTHVGSSDKFKPNRSGIALRQGMGESVLGTTARRRYNLRIKLPPSPGLDPNARVFQGLSEGLFTNMRRSSSVKIGTGGRSSFSIPRQARIGRVLRALFLIALPYVYVLLFISLLIRIGIAPTPHQLYLRRYSIRSKVSDSLLPYLPSTLSNLLFDYSSIYGSFPQQQLAFSSNSAAAAIFKTPRHPIIPYLLSSRREWHQTLKSQSATLVQARKSYIRRYEGLEPPPGFNQWFEFAKFHNHTLIDKYDGLMEDLKPFRRLGGKEVRRRAAELKKVPGITILSVREGGRKIRVKSTSGRWAPGRAMEDMLKSVADSIASSNSGLNFVSDSEWLAGLPDMDIAINEKPEGRVLPRREWTAKDQTYLDREKEGNPSIAVSGGRWKAWKKSFWELGMGIRAGERERKAKKVYKMKGRKRTRQEDKNIARKLEEISERENYTDPQSQPTLEHFRAAWPRGGSVWDSYRRACPPGSPARRLVESTRSVEYIAPKLQELQLNMEALRHTASRRVMHQQAIPPTRELTFNNDMDAAYDICFNPSVHSLHSAFFSDQRSIGYLYPVFSSSKPTGFADILIPPHQYWTPAPEYTYEYEYRTGRTMVPSDPPWEQKSPTLFWRGKVTKGAETPSGRSASFQKERLVKLAGGACSSSKVLVSINGSESALISVSDTAAKINRVIVDIALICDPAFPECAYLQRSGYRIESPRIMSEMWRHKLILDLDEVGFSPKFAMLMESRSAVVKSSIQREFWRSWAVPWYHYIPLSSSYDELYNIQTFFAGLPPSLVSNSTPLTSLTPQNRPSLIKRLDGSPFDSDRALQDIAEAGTRWRQRHLRKIDMQIYIYRLLIEWARILTDDS